MNIARPAFAHEHELFASFTESHCFWCINDNTMHSKTATPYNMTVSNKLLHSRWSRLQMSLHVLSKVHTPQVSFVHDHKQSMREVQVPGLSFSVICLTSAPKLYNIWNAHWRHIQENNSKYDWLCKVKETQAFPSQNPVLPKLRLELCPYIIREHNSLYTVEAKLILCRL